MSEKNSDAAHTFSNIAGCMSTKLSDEEKAQVTAYLELIKLNSQLAAIPPGMLHRHPAGGTITKLQEILYIAAANLKDRKDLSAEDMRNNFIAQRVLVIKSRLCMSSGWIEQPITWKNNVITEKIVKLLREEGFTVDYFGITYDSDGDECGAKNETLDNANVFRVFL